jgi:transcriptional regulator with XRE-family HTH domain
MKPRDLERKVGQNIRKYRMKKGLTLLEASNRYHCALRFWQSFETGKNFELYTLERIAKVLDVGVWKLLK